MLEHLPGLDTQDKTKLKKLKINHLLDFVLHYTPKNYTNTYLSTELIPNAQATLKVQIQAIQTFGFGKNARLHINAFMLDFHKPLEMTIFHPKPFHKKIFTPDSIHYALGKLQYYNGYTLIQPKSISEINTIALHFKTTILANKSLQKLAQKLISIESLNAHLPPKVSERIYEIFHPDEAFALNFSRNNALPSPHLNALKFVEIYHYLSRLSLKKHDFKANFICQNDITPFLHSLPFSLTQGQRQAIESIRNDLASPIASKRLIMGDVGCGKTIVILSAALSAYPRKSILMAPTSVLATQLYEQAKALLPKEVKIELITAQNKDTDSDNAHLIIGTQALLYRDLALKDVALVMSDEQHRFGTNQRYKLERFFENLSKSENAHKSRPHVLQFSATPIPRTLAMINSQLIKLSVIRDLPFKKDISTLIIGKTEFKNLIAHLKFEISKGNQAIIVYPLVNESQKLDYLSLNEGLGFWERHFEGVYSTSGKDKDKQRIIDEFAQKGSLLLATTLIEVGISLPKVSSIVIVAPERLGLATLHQLRGRVSRNGLKGYCFLYTHNQNNERLRSFVSTLSGFEIAELDLKYRNAGDLLSGERQSGDEFLYFDMAEDEEILNEATKFLQENKNLK